MKVAPSFLLSVVICCLDSGGGGSLAREGGEMSIVLSHLPHPISNTNDDTI